MLTKKQHELLKFIHGRLLKDGPTPSFDEMRVGLNLKSKSGIHRMLTALEERGYVRRIPNRARALEIVKLPQVLAREATTGRISDKTQPEEGDSASALAQSVIELPMMGRIAAGTPSEAIAHASHNVSVPADMVGRHGKHYALQVHGDSMIGAGINDGDLVVIRKTDVADNGDIVVALVDDIEATLKTFFRDGKRIVLEAANPAYQARVCSEDSVRVQGRLVGLVRTY